MRKFIATVALSVLAIPLIASADTWPSRPIKFVVPFAAGGTTDIVSRIMADAMGRHLGQPIIVENQGGATGIIGTEAVVRAQPDGYTVGVATITTHAINPVVRQLKFDVSKDLLPVVNFTNSPLVFSVRQGVDVKSMQELIGKLKASPDKYSFGSSGPGSVGHLQIELLQSLTGTKVLHVPYKGMAPVIQDMLSATVDMTIDALPSSLPYIKTGKLKPLAVSGQTRAPNLPEVQTYNEAGLPQLNMVAWTGIVVPSKTPADIVSKLNTAANQALAEPRVRESIERLFIQPAGGTAQAFGELMQKDMEIYRATARKVKIEIN